MSPKPPLILASQSPRRAQLLREAGVVFEQRSPPFADPDQPPDRSVLFNSGPGEYAQALALQKADSLARGMREEATILAADTICADDQGNLIGKPKDRDHAEQMIRSFVNTRHEVITGVVMMVLNKSGQGSFIADSVSAAVHFGSIADRQLGDYLATDDWRGKAGGYNLFDRQAAGWPITVEGDPTTVVGLPMRWVRQMLDSSLLSGG